MAESTSQIQAEEYIDNFLPIGTIKTKSDKGN